MSKQECEEIQKDEWYTSLQVALSKDKNKENINFEEIFKNHAKELMSQYALTNGSETFLFKEIEYYFYDETRHPDPYVHKNDKQKKSGCFYFHASGLDITFGQDDFYGGILVRGIQPMSEKASQIFGPINSVTKLLSTSIIYNKDYYSKISDCSKHSIRVCKINKSIELLSSTRVGLSPSPCDLKFFIENEKKVIPFIFRKYRFLCSNSNGDYREKLKINFYNQAYYESNSKTVEISKC